MSNIIVTCDHCGGSGIDLITEGVCPRCSGDGKVEAHGFHATTRYGVVDIHTLTAIMDSKLNSIIAEQASQREDLTAALTQIWNKVKDL